MMGYFQSFIIYRSVRSTTPLWVPAYVIDAQGAHLVTMPLFTAYVLGANGVPLDTMPLVTAYVLGATGAPLATIPLVTAYQTVLDARWCSRSYHAHLRARCQRRALSCNALSYRRCVLSGHAPRYHARLRARRPRCGTVNKVPWISFNGFQWLVVEWWRFW